MNFKKKKYKYEKKTMKNWINERSNTLKRVIIVFRIRPMNKTKQISYTIYPKIKRKKHTNAWFFFFFECAWLSFVVTILSRQFSHTDVVDFDLIIYHVYCIIVLYGYDVQLENKWIGWVRKYFFSLSPSVNGRWKEYRTRRRISVRHLYRVWPVYGTK